MMPVLNRDPKIRKIQKTKETKCAFDFQLHSFQRACCVYAFCYRIFEKAEKTKRIDADMDCLLSLFFFLELFYNTWPEELPTFSVGPNIRDRWSFFFFFFQ